jgi:hypothetical protein
VTLPINLTDKLDLNSLKHRIAEKSNTSGSTATAHRNIQEKMLAFAPKQSKETITNLVSQTKHIIS